MKKKMLLMCSVFTCICMMFAFTACGGSDGGENSSGEAGFEVPFEAGTTDAVQVILEDGETEIMTTEELLEVNETNGAKFDSTYKKADVIVVGIIEEIRGATNWQGQYEMEAELILENGWEVEARSPEYVKDYNIGDIVACKGKLSGVWSTHLYLFAMKAPQPEIQLFEKAGSEDASNEKESSSVEQTAECYEEIAALPKVDSVVTGVSEKGSSQSSSSGTAGSSFSAEYTYEIKATSKEDAEELLKQYYDYINDHGLSTEKQDDDSYAIMDGDTTIAILTLEDDDGYYYAEMELLSLDQSYIDAEMEELEDWE